MEQPINCLDKVALLLRFTTAKDYQVVLNRKVQEATEIGDISFIPFVGKSIEVVNTITYYEGNPNPTILCQQHSRYTISWIHSSPPLLP